MRQRLRFKFLGIEGLILLAKSTLADIGSLPGAAQPEIVVQSLASRQPAYVPPVSPPIVTAVPTPSGLSEKAKKITFHLNDIVLEGNHVYSTTQLRPIFVNDMHKTALELRYDLGIGRFLLQSLEFYTFYDAGVVWNFKYIGGTPRKTSGTTTGVGTRFYFTKYVSGNVMWTQTLTKQIAAEEFIGDGRRPRVYFSVVANVD